MTHAAFELLQKNRIESLNLEVASYEHRPTGARHIHLATDDIHNAFLVAFLTVPQDSTGVAHVLEHTALCGSERYPVRDPFFMMLRRSLATFMNAFTASDWTAYPFASQSRKDFFNLLEVYLDAAFFPNLAELDFMQEGCRVEWETPEPTAPPRLVFKGVVFNEMKGAMSAPTRVLWETMARHLFPTTTYHHNSGGSPEKIPDLTWDNLKAFHARHYHPSNAVFMTYGDIPATTHQQYFEERVLSRFTRLPVDFHVPDEQRFQTPKTVEAPYAQDDPDSLSGKTHIVMSWLLGRSIDLETLLQGHLLTGVLMNNSASPLLHVLETTHLGTAPSPNCGLDDDQREMVFTCGVEGSEPEHATAVENLILETLRRVAEEGLPIDHVEAVLHQLELSQREIGGNGLPYGLKLMLHALPAALHQGDPVSLLALDPVLDKLRQEIQDPEYVKRLVRTWLLENPHRIRVTLRPDATLNATKAEQERARLDQLAATLDEAGTTRIQVQTEALQQRQETPDDPERLPKVGLADVPTHLPIPEGVERALDDMSATWYDQPTNRLFYLTAHADLPALPPDLVDLLPLYGAFLAEVGVGGRDYMETQTRQSAVSGGVSARISVRANVEDINRFQGHLILSSKALARNHADMSQLLQETFVAPRFDEQRRLRELVAQIRGMSENRITDNGHILAMYAATQGMSPTVALNNRWGGLEAIQRLKTLDKALDHPDRLAAFSADLERLRDHLTSGTRPHLVIVGEQPRFEQYAESLTRHWRAMGTPSSAPFHPATEQRRVQVGWIVNSPVNFCAKAYPAVPYHHPDAPILTVLGQYLRWGYLHTAIREKGGAYGSGAGYDSDAGAFRFHSYRDPRLRETLDDFDRSLDWLTEQPSATASQSLEEAILSVIGSIDRPLSPAGEARNAFFNARNGRTPALRRWFRQQVLRVTLDDLARCRATYFSSQRASIAVVGGARALEEARELFSDLYTLTAQSNQ
jgi:hypothetical protein